MPPLPNTIQDETTNLVDLLSRRQKDLQDFQIPRLRDFKGSLSTQQQYAAEIREDLETFARHIEELESLMEDHERERERRQVTHHTRQFAESLDRMKKDTRVALLTSKRAIDSMVHSNKDELFRSSVMSEKRSDEKSGDALINASNDVTEALRRTIGLMQGELERSVFSSQMLEQSSANLRSATAAHDTLSSLLSISKHIITALEKSDWLDRLLILAAVAFFFLVVLFILKQRVLDKGLRIAFWWTRFLPNFSDDAELLKTDSADIGTVMTVAATASSLFATTAIGKLPTSPQPAHEIDSALSTLVPSDSILLAQDIKGADDAIQDLHSIDVPSDLTSQTNVVPHNEPTRHQEL